MNTVKRMKTFAILLYVVLLSLLLMVLSPLELIVRCVVAMATTLKNSAIQEAKTYGGQLEIARKTVVAAWKALVANHDRMNKALDDYEGI